MVAIAIKEKELTSLCKRWPIKELALFGSVLRNDFQPDSDVDILVTFADDSRLTLFDHQRLQAELEKVFERRIDLISRKALEQSHNAARRAAILQSAESIYES
jgi:predicted nucleotidyltransferase